MGKSSFAVLAALILITAVPAWAKEAGVFFPASLAEKARANISRDPWAADQRRQIVRGAEPWVKMSDGELWSLMFGPTIHRSWHVLSDGICPSCRRNVVMYDWIVDGLNSPWKMRCPRCRELFPKNDFGAFYRSGIDEHGIFDPHRADRSLLFNAEHPDPKDPLRIFGVDDGTGYIQDGRKWQFVSTYLIYGQWKQAVLGGIRNLGSAYVVTGDRKYAHKAAILLDRVADLYPTFDYITQADLYDGRNQSNGYVSVWHDACEETRELALGYDMIFDGIRDDGALVAFLSGKSKAYGLENPKASIEDITRNIEDRILRDALKNRPKVESNYPRTDVTYAVIEAVLGWPEHKDKVYAVLDPMLERATAVDGVTGEKGLPGYTCYTIRGVANMLAQFSRLDPGFVRDVLNRHPRVHDMYRFHIDTWSYCRNYPLIGDAGWFGENIETYVGMDSWKGFQGSPNMYYFVLSPSTFKLLWDLYEVTGDTGFVQMIYLMNEKKLDGLPYDLFSEDSDAFRKKVGDVISKVGPYPEQKSVNKQQWHLGILRSGGIDTGRALWLLYDAWGGHGHANHMTLGLYAKGLDLMPDFGYKPVNYGGWDAPKAVWYGKSASHNTVVVDGADHGNGFGATTLWADGKQFRAIRASGPQPTGGQQFERTAALIDISDRDAYILDVFRVVGGKDHSKFMGSHFGKIATQGLKLQPAPDYGYGTLMRNFHMDGAPQPGWSVDWNIEDRYHCIPEGSDVHLRYTDLTEGAQAFTAEAWIQAGNFNSNLEEWIPRVMTRRQSMELPLASTFVSVIEPYEKKSNIRAIRRLALQTADGETYGDNCAAVEVRLADNRRDLLVSVDAENPLGRMPAVGVLAQKDWGLRTDAELCMVRKNAYGGVSRIAICKGSFLEIGVVSIKLKGKTDFIEIAIEHERTRVVSGNPEDVIGE